MSNRTFRPAARPSPVVARAGLPGWAGVAAGIILAVLMGWQVWSWAGQPIPVDYRGRWQVVAARGTHGPTELILEIGRRELRSLSEGRTHAVDARCTGRDGERVDLWVDGAFASQLDLRGDQLAVVTDGLETLYRRAE
jgi:hypothetical protein